MIVVRSQVLTQDFHLSTISVVLIYLRQLEGLFTGVSAYELTSADSRLLPQSRTFIFRKALIKLKHITFFEFRLSSLLQWKSVCCSLKVGSASLYSHVASKRLEEVLNKALS
jgi:uncharacterized membrane protein YdbT with pleckstrin-like domain